MDPDRIHAASSQPGHSGALNRAESRSGISDARQGGDPKRRHRARTQGTLPAFRNLLRSSRCQRRLPLRRGSACGAEDTFAKGRPERPGLNHTRLVYRLLNPLFVFSARHTARKARPEGARKLSPGFTLGFGFIVETLKGRPLTRRPSRNPGAPSGLLTLERVSQGKPWAMLSWSVRATEWERPNSFGPCDAKHIPGFTLGLGTRTNRYENI